MAGTACWWTFSASEVADAVDRVLDHPDRMAALRRAARETILQNYALESCLQKQVQLAEQLVSGALPL